MQPLCTNHGIQAGKKKGNEIEKEKEKKKKHSTSAMEQTFRLTSLNISLARSPALSLSDTYSWSEYVTLEVRLIKFIRQASDIAKIVQKKLKEGTLSHHFYLVW